MQLLTQTEEAVLCVIVDANHNMYVVKFTLVYGDYNSTREDIYRHLMDISHPNIIKVYEVGSVKSTSPDYETVYNTINWDCGTNTLCDDIVTQYGQDIPFVVLQHIDGCTLANMNVNDPVSLVQDVFSAIKVLQSHHITHDDLQSENIMYDFVSQQYIVIDFDLSYFDYTGDNNTTDKEYFIETLGIVLFKPNKHFIANSSTGEVTNLSLPETTAINKFYNFALLSSVSDTSLDVYISVLSNMLGDYNFTLQLEHNKTEIWRYGAKVQ